jgi:glycosyltransferase involved in cell wall biosynthesis
VSLLAILEAHPVQYHAPVYRALQTEFGIPVTAIYGSDVGAAAYHDAEFGLSLSWDTDLLTGYDARFLARGTRTGHGSPDNACARGAGRLLRKLKPEAVMLVGYGSRFDREALVEAWPKGVPLLFRAESTDHAIEHTGMRSWARDTALRILYRRFARVLYIGQRSLRHYRRLGVPDGKLISAPYCVDTTPFACSEAARRAMRGPARAELGLSNPDLMLLFAGKISERKGPDVLLQAVKELPEELRSRMCVCFLGDGQLKGRMEELAVTAPAVRTRFLGFQNQTRLSRYYHAADLLVLPSRWGETWGLVVNEALHHGVPCVVSDAVGCAPDLIRTGVTGRMFETGSDSSLARALSESIALVRNAHVRDRCRQQVSLYTVREAARGIARAYGDVARSNKKEQFDRVATMA